MSFVIVMTAGAGELPADKRSGEMTRRLRDLGWIIGITYHMLVCCEGTDKGRLCRDMKVSLFIDDEDRQCRDVMANSPGTVVLQVAKPRAKIM